MAPILTQEEADKRHQQYLADMLILEAFTLGEEPTAFYDAKPMRKKRRTIPKRLRAEVAYENCLRRRRGRKGQKRCTSLMYANCLTQSGTTKKSKTCKRIMRARIHRL